MWKEVDSDKPGDGMFGESNIMWTKSKRKVGKLKYELEELGLSSYRYQ